MASRKVSINFAVPDEHPSREYHTFATVVATGKPLKIAPQPVQLVDLRARIGKVDFEEEGFAWLKTYLKAKRVGSWNHDIRRRIPEDSPEFPKEFDLTKLQPATVAHVDLSQKDSLLKVLKVFGLSMEEASGRRLAVVNVWRPLIGPVVDSPLAVCDAKTASQEDIHLTTDFYGEGSFITFAERQKWYYVKDQMPDEVLLFRCFDSTIGPGQSGVTPHSALMDRERMGTEKYECRQSIEVRCAVEY
ncbi:hypothetical protein RQP46_000070 [Phenoliferia psychrophenolica]